MIQIETPLTKDIVKSLHYGDEVAISGVIYTARDAAHKKMAELILENKPLPFDVLDQIIYYVGPCPNREGEVIGSAGPTSSYRMDAYTPKLLELGLSGMIGKGLRNEEVISAMKKYCAVYFGAIGGTGALISECIISQEIVAFPELGTEAIRKLCVRNFQTNVIIDCFGNNLYTLGRKNFVESQRV